MGASWQLFGDLGCDLLKNRESLKTNNPPSLLLCYLKLLGRYFGDLGAMLGHLDAMLAHLGAMSGYVEAS